MFHAVETSSGLRVRRLGAIATSSNEYERAAAFEPPMSTSAMVIAPCSWGLRASSARRADGIHATRPL